jgi:hypothetical protein
MAGSTRNGKGIKVMTPSLILGIIFGGLGVVLLARATPPMLDYPSTPGAEMEFCLGLLLAIFGLGLLLL